MNRSAIDVKEIEASANVRQKYVSDESFALTENSKELEVRKAIAYQYEVKLAWVYVDKDYIYRQYSKFWARLPQAIQDELPGMEHPARCSPHAVVVQLRDIYVHEP